MGEAQELGQRWFETVKLGDPDAVQAIVADDIDFLAAGQPLTDREQIAGFVSGYKTAFSDMDFVIRSWVEQGDTAVAEGSFTGTHDGPMQSPMGEVPPTGRSVDLPFTTVFQARDGKLTAHRAYWDNGAFMMQLGLMPPPGQ
jgi:steroid delta-isomerase-like uncharacterized protein